MPTIFTHSVGNDRESNLQTLTHADHDSIVQTIQSVERRTTAEIRVVVKRRGKPDLRSQARELFYRFGMHDTRDQNGGDASGRAGQPSALCVRRQRHPCKDHRALSGKGSARMCERSFIPDQSQRALPLPSRLSEFRWRRTFRRCQATQTTCPIKSSTKTSGRSM